MDPQEARRRVIAQLLQAERELSVTELARMCRTTQASVRAALGDLIAEQLVLETRLGYRWAAAAARQAADETDRMRRGLEAAVGPARAQARAEPVELGSPGSRAFHEFIVQTYQPPADKRLLVILQCCVRRPFSTSPSHAAMRRAIATATGCDPARDFADCPVHVVVLASKIGPAPYEFEDVWPPNVGAIGVKQYRPDMYERVRAPLAGRMADYLVAHGSHYQHMATFTEGRYAEVMHDALTLARGRRQDLPDCRVLPETHGVRVVRLGGSAPRPYWERYWIQLHQEVVSWLPAAQRREANRRLGELDVELR